MNLETFYSRLIFNSFVGQIFNLIIRKSFQLWLESKIMLNFLFDFGPNLKVFKLWLESKIILKNVKGCILELKIRQLIDGIIKYKNSVLRTFFFRLRIGNS